MHPREPKPAKPKPGPFRAVPVLLFRPGIGPRQNRLEDYGRRFCKIVVGVRFRFPNTTRVATGKEKGSGFVFPLLFLCFPLGRMEVAVPMPLRSVPAVFVTVRAHSLPCPQRCQFCFRLRCVDMFRPISRLRQRSSA